MSTHAHMHTCRGDPTGSHDHAHECREAMHTSVCERVHTPGIPRTVPLWTGRRGPALPTNRRTCWWPVRVLPSAPTWLIQMWVCGNFARQQSDPGGLGLQRLHWVMPAFPRTGLSPFGFNIRCAPASPDGQNLSGRGCWGRGQSGPSGVLLRPQHWVLGDPYLRWQGHAAPGTRESTERTRESGLLHVCGS